MGQWMNVVILRETYHGPVFNNLKYLSKWKCKHLNKTFRASLNIDCSSSMVSMKLENWDLKALLLPHSGSVFRDIETGMTECLKYYRNSSQHSSLTSSQFQSLNIACAQSYADPIKNILFKCYSWQNMPLTSFKYRTASTGRQKRKKPLISHFIIVKSFLKKSVWISHLLKMFSPSFLLLDIS